MAELKFFIYDIDNNKTELDGITSFELSKDINAACDGLRLRFVRDDSLFEIYRIEVFFNHEKIFFGYCDTQRETSSEKGFEGFIYARSSAAILVDNEAKPFAYSSPSARSLFNHNAKEFGFIFNLPNLSCACDYRVCKGTSCYGAINDFIYAMSGKNIIVNSSNELTVLNGENTVILNDYFILSEKRSINRGEAISKIDYKRESSDRYIYHIKSRFLEENKINCSRKLNLSSLPQWQRQNRLKNKLESSSASYYETEIVLNGCHNFNLYDRVQYQSKYFGSIQNCYISSVCVSFTEKGAQTILTINKSIDLKEINYVDE